MLSGAILGHLEAQMISESEQQAFNIWAVEYGPFWILKVMGMCSWLFAMFVRKVCGGGDD